MLIKRKNLREKRKDIFVALWSLTRTRVSLMSQNYLILAKIYFKMELTYRLNASELNEDFLNTLKKIYKGKDLEVTIQVKEDETEYLLKSEANRSQLLKAIKDVKGGKSLKTLDMNKLKALLK